MVLRLAAIVTILAAFPAVSSAERRSAHRLASGPAAKIVSCDLSSDNRAATFYARMDTFSGVSKMQIRFQLLERLGRDDVWSKVDVPALRQWHTSQPGVKRFGWKQTVDSLRIGGAYRARVQYRWLSVSGSALSTDSRDTPVCRGPLPNVAVGGLSVRPGPSDETRIYRVTVENRGKIAADQVDVSLSVDHAILDTVTLDRLEAGETASTSFTGPVCKGGVRVRVDPGNSIGETIEDDNSELFACP
jgi:hypothetical protein